MTNRLDKLGIKQVIRLEWMEYTLQLLLSNMASKEIRNELVDYLEDKKQSGGIGSRGNKTYTMAVNILMQAWVTPAVELIQLRDACIEYARGNSNSNMLLHWVMIGSAYPFWQNTASVMGRLFEFQKVIAKQQIVNRLKEVYGDRQTVSRNTRYVIRSFIAWKVISVSGKLGYYSKSPNLFVDDDYLVGLLYESVLLNTKKLQLPYKKMTSSNSLFHFLLTPPTPEKYNRLNPRVSVISNVFNDSIFAIGRE